MRYKRIVLLFLKLLVTWFFIHTVVICTDGLIHTSKSADLAIILGTKVNEDGSLSERLVKRLDAGIELYKSKQVRQLLVSGGLGKEGYWEGDKMKQYLLLQGIREQDVYVDNYGNNTRLTVQNTLKLKGQIPIQSVIVVSQYFHLTRTKMLFRKKGFKKVYSTPAKYFEWRDLYSIPREFFAFYTQL